MTEDKENNNIHNHGHRCNHHEDHQCNHHEGHHCSFSNFERFLNKALEKMEHEERNKD